LKQRPAKRTRSVGRTKPAIEAVASEIASSGGIAEVVVADATKEGDVIELFDAAGSDIDLAIYNAGKNTPGRIIEMDAAYFEHSWRVACLGGFLFGREALRRMQANKAGTLLSPAQALHCGGDRATVPSTRRKPVYEFSRKRWPRNTPMREFMLVTSSSTALSTALSRWVMEILRNDDFVQKVSIAKCSDPLCRRRGQIRSDLQRRWLRLAIRGDRYDRSPSRRLSLPCLFSCCG
jgi:Enoyl-(Acyl carrier protein) reductase